MERDEIDTIMQAWARETPYLDLSRLESYLRLTRMGRRLVRQVDQTATGLGLDTGQWGVLAALRRSGPYFRLTPKALCKTTMVNSSVMTKRVDRLERSGLVVRTPDPSDRRGIYVTLTAKGLEASETAARATFAVAHEMMGTISDEERETLVAILRKMQTGLIARSTFIPEGLQGSAARDTDGGPPTGVTSAEG
jgi:DNA-binding MarR family transcriptional regulator